MELNLIILSGLKELAQGDWSGAQSFLRDLWNYQNWHILTSENKVCMGIFFFYL